MLKLVCISGIDGTGKTTLAYGLAEALCRRGIRAAYVYGRTYPVVSRALMALGRLTMLRGHNQWHDYTGYTASKKSVMGNRLLAGIYRAAILLDYYPQVWLKLLPHLLSRRLVVCDRYIYDTVISDLAVHLSYSPEQTDRALERALKWLPRPMLTALLDVPPEVAFSRKDDVPHLDYLRERRSWYLRLQCRPEVKAFDGGKAPDTVLQAVLAASVGAPVRDM